MKFATLEVAGGMLMERCEKTLVAKIHNTMGVARSSLSEDSACTHQGAKYKVAGCVGGHNVQDPNMVSG